MKNNDDSISLTQMESNLSNQSVLSAMNSLSLLIFADETVDDKSLGVIKSLLPKCLQYLSQIDDLDTLDTIIGLLGAVLRGETAVTGSNLFNNGDVLTIVSYLSRLIPLLCHREVLTSHENIVKNIVKLVLMMQTTDIKALRHFIEDLIDLLKDLHEIRCVNALASKNIIPLSSLQNISLLCLVRVYQHCDCVRQSRTTGSCNFPCCNINKVQQKSSTLPPPQSRQQSQYKTTECKHETTAIAFDLKSNISEKTETLQILITIMLGELIKEMDLFLYEEQIILFNSLLDVIMQRHPGSINKVNDASYMASTRLRCVNTDSLSILLQSMHNELPTYLINDCIDVAIMLLDSRSAIHFNAPKFFRSQEFDVSLSKYLFALFNVIPHEALEHYRLNYIFNLILENLQERNNNVLKRCLCWIIETKLMKNYKIILLRINDIIPLLLNCNQWWNNDNQCLFSLIRALRVCCSDVWLPKYFQDLEEFFHKKHIGLVSDDKKQIKKIKLSNASIDNDLIDKHIFKIVWPNIRLLIETSSDKPILDVKQYDSSINHFLTLEIVFRLFLPYFQRDYTELLLNVLIDKLMNWIVKLEKLLLSDSIENLSDKCINLCSIILQRIIILVEHALHEIPETALTRLTMGMMNIVCMPWLDKNNISQASTITQKFPQLLRDTCLRFVGILPTMCNDDRERLMIDVALRSSILSNRTIAILVLPLVLVRSHTGIFRNQAVWKYLKLLPSLWKNKNDTKLIRNAIAWNLGFMVCICSDQKNGRKNLVNFIPNLKTTNNMVNNYHPNNNNATNNNLLINYKNSIYSQIFPVLFDKKIANQIPIHNNNNNDNNNDTDKNNNNNNNNNNNDNNNNRFEYFNNEQSVHLTCTVCDTGKCNAEYAMNNMDNNVNNNILASYLNLLKPSEDPFIRLCMTRSLFRIINHVNIEFLKQYEIAQLIIDLILDKDSNIRHFANHLIEKIIIDNNDNSPIINLFEDFYYKIDEQNNSYVESETSEDTIDLILSITKQPLSKVRSMEFKSSKNARLLHTVDRFWKALKCKMKLLQKQQQYNDDLKESALIAIASIGIRVKDEAQAYILWILTKHLMHADISIRAVCCEQFKRISKNCDKSLKLIIREHSKHLMPSIFRYALHTPSILSEVIDTLLEVSMDEFLDYAIPLVLPYFVMTENREVIELVAQLKEKTIFDLIFECAYMYLPSLFMNEQISTSVFQFLNDLLYKTSLNELVNYFRSDICTALLQRMGEKDETTVKSAEKALALVMHITNGTLSVQGGKEKLDDEDFLTPTSANDLAHLLAHNALYIFNKLNRKLTRKRHRSKDEKDQALRSLNAFIRLTGKELAPYIPRVIATLKLCMQDSNIRCSVCQVWYTFIQQIGINNIGPSLTQIVVILLEFINDDKCNIKIAEILRYLLVEKRIELQNYITEIPVLPNVPFLSEVIKSVEEYMGKMSFLQQLQRQMLVISHQSVNVRSQGLSQLCTLLQRPDNRHKLYQTALEGEMGLVVSQLVKKLLERCADTANQVRFECSKTIGELGAIDPGLLQVTLHNQREIEETDDDKLAILIIEKLIIPYHKAAVDTDTQDRALYALQELLKFIGCTSDTSKLYERYGQLSMKEYKKTLPRKYHQNIRGLINWSLFDNDDIRVMIQPSLHSRYKYYDDNFQPNLNNRRKNIFGKLVFFKSETCKKPNEWLACWTRHLIITSLGTRSTMFKACLGLVRKDLNSAQYLLPYLVINTLRYGKLEHIVEIENEILSLISLEELNNNNNLTKDDQICMQIIFDLIDTITQWITVLEVSKNDKSSSKYRNNINNNPESIDKIKNFLDSIPKLDLAKAAYICNANTRALKYLELHLRQKKVSWINEQQLQNVDLWEYSKNLSGGWDTNDIELLQQIYALVDERDGMKGIARLRRTTTIDQQARDYEVEGLWSEALTCFEQCINWYPNRIYYQVRLLNCLKNLGHWQSCLTHARGTIDMYNATESPSTLATLKSYAVQAAWRLHKWDILNEMLEDDLITTNPLLNFEIDLGRLLLAIKTNADDTFHNLLISCRNRIMESLVAASRESYRRSYQYFVQLHMLTEIQHFQSCYTNKADFKISTQFWHQRLERLESSFHIKEPVLSLQRTLYKICGFNKNVGDCWLLLAQEARHSKRFDIAAGALLHAELECSQMSLVEKCKLLRAKGLQHEAMIILSDDINSRDEASRLSSSKICAESEVLLGEWYQEYGARNSITVKDVLQNALKLQPGWDKAHYAMAKFHDAEYNVTRESKRIGRSDSTSKKKLSSLQLLLKYYIETLSHGSTYLYQALPRLLTLWFEFGENNIVDTPKLRNRMLKAIDQIASFQWLTALPQIISRICHENNDVWEFILNVIVKVFCDYPDQCMWSLASLLGSSRQDRKVRVDIVLKNLLKIKNQSTFQKYKQTNIKDYIDKIQRFFKELINLCQYNTERRTSLKISKFRGLTNLLPIQLVVPVQTSLSVTLPSTFGESDVNGHVETQTFRAFSEYQVSIEQIQSRIQVLRSKEAPKKLTIIGSDGNFYPFLCKMEAKGDMRKNSRVMEFNAVINRLFRYNDASRLRKLQLRTFSVLPLSEGCGLIEWVPNTVTLRDLVERNDIKNGTGKKHRILVKKLYDGANNVIESKKHEYMLKTYKTLLEKFPPQFHTWLLDAFPEPTEWFENRLIYTRSAAVWSMVGYVVGLGDRHLENILIDKTNGECIHVDFDCLFDKARLLKVPERVYFRLTPNVIDGFGITGYEGVYRHSCEVTMSILRNNKDLLLNVLQTFVHDPLVEWHESSSSTKYLTLVKNRLTGKWKKSLPLSVKGHVHELIKDATDKDNLCEMYIGWMPWR